MEGDYKLPNLKINNLATHILKLSLDYIGYQIIVDKLQTATSKEKEMVFDEIFPSIEFLMTHEYGNHVIREFIHGSRRQRQELMDKLCEHFLNIGKKFVSAGDRIRNLLQPKQS